MALVPGSDELLASVGSHEILPQLLRGFGSVAVPGPDTLHGSQPTEVLEGAVWDHRLRGPWLGAPGSFLRLCWVLLHIPRACKPSRSLIP